MVSPLSIFRGAFFDLQCQTLHLNLIVYSSASTAVVITSQQQKRKKVPTILSQILLLFSIRLNCRLDVSFIGQLLCLLSLSHREHTVWRIRKHNCKNHNYNDRQSVAHSVQLNQSNVGCLTYGWIPIFLYVTPLRSRRGPGLHLAAITFALWPMNACRRISAILVVCH